MRPALLAGLVLLAFAAAAPAAPRVSEFGMAVPDGAHARAAGAEVRSAVLRPGQRFDLVGLRWAGRGEPRRAWLRTRTGGRWRAWVPITAADGGGHTSDPVWTDGAEALQLRYASLPRGARLRFVRVTQRVRLRARPRQAAAPPAMVLRREWDPNNACPPRAAPSYGRVNLAFVHHTVSENTYAPEDSPAIVLAICRFHRDDNGWNDIGYNFLVDRYGRLFEGRAGGIDKAVIGAQAQGWNSQSTSVSNIGTFSDEGETDAALAAMADLLAWKLPLHGVPVTGQVTLTSAGGETNRWPAGARVTFERISGHRDGGKTECPGQALYDQLPQLRTLAAQRAGGTTGVPAPPGSVTLSALSTELLYPEPARLTGALTGDGDVWLQVAAGAGYRTVARTTPAQDGSWAVELPVERGYALRALQVLRDGTHGAVSAPVTVALTPALRATGPRRVLAGTTIPVRGTIAPRQRWISVSLAIVGRSGRAHFVRRVALRTRANGTFAGRIRVGKAGLYRVRASFAGTTFVRPATAKDLYVRAVSSRAKLTGGKAGPAG